MDIFQQIASRRGIDPNDRERVREFFENELFAPGIEASERDAIIAAVVSKETYGWVKSETDRDQRRDERGRA